MKYSATGSRYYMLLLSLLGWFSCLAAGSTGLRPAEHSSFVPSSPTNSGPSADSLEERTLRQGVAQRQPAESVEAFLQRVLPASFANPDDPPQLMQYTWRPSAFGQQLFFSANDPHEPYRLYVFMLDPYQADTYAVERFEVTPPDSDWAQLAALFFADANRDGRKELLVLVNSSVVTPTVIDGMNWPAHTTHYYTGIYGYLLADQSQRPRYQEYPHRHDLDELETAAEVRQVLAIPNRKQKTRKASQSK
jgi:hypothetical protein